METPRALPLPKLCNSALRISTIRLRSRTVRTSSPTARKSCCKTFGSATGTRSDPITVMALSFLVPSLAPKPPCPATEVVAVWMVAMRDRRSPRRPDGQRLDLVPVSGLGCLLRLDGI